MSSPLLTDVGIGESAEETVDQGHIAVELVLDPTGEEVAGHVAERLDAAGDTQRDLAEHDAAGEAVDGGSA